MRKVQQYRSKQGFHFIVGSILIPNSYHIRPMLRIIRIEIEKSPHYQGMVYAVEAFGDRRKREINKIDTLEWNLMSMGWENVLANTERHNNLLSKLRR